MAEREMNGKALLDQLYRGLDTMPAAKAESDARDLRRLTDEFLGKPTELAVSGQHAAPAPSGVFKAAPASRAARLRSPLVILFLVAVAGVIAAGALRDSDKRAALPASPPAVIPVPEPAPVEQAAEAPPEPAVVLVNPFDATETFTFPPGTSKAEAREQMAALLLQRAAERRAHVPRARKLASEPRAPSTGHGS
jgi:hypothetical protein